MTKRNRDFLNELFKDRAGLRSHLWIEGAHRANQSKPVALIIWRRDEAGLGATLGTVLQGLNLARSIGAEPYVDTKRTWTSYEPSDGLASGSPSSWSLWDELFLPVSEVTESDLEHGGYRIMAMDGSHPSPIHSDPFESYQELWERIRLNDVTSNYIEQSLADLDISSRTLAVHFRTGDMRRAPRHPTPPTLGQIAARIGKLLDTESFDKIFLATQMERDVTALKKIFGTRVQCFENLRPQSEKNAAHYAFADRTRPITDATNLSRPDGPELARQALRDMIAMSRCGGIVGGNSNMVLMAEVIRQGRFESRNLIDNGRNPASPSLSHVRWKVKHYLNPAPRRHRYFDGTTNKA